MRVAGCLLSLLFLGCVNTDAIDNDLAALKESDAALATSIEELERDLRKVENRVMARLAESAREQQQRMEELALAASRAGTEIVDLRHEIGRSVDAKGAAIEKQAADAHAALTRDISALREELARLGRELEALSRRVEKAAAPPAAPPAKEGVQL